MKHINTLFNLKFLSMLLILHLIFILLKNYISPDTPNSIDQYDFTVLSLITTIVSAPILEELIFRYWAYGKNILLQVGMSLSLTLYLLIDLFQFLKFGIINDIPNFYVFYNLRSIIILTIGLILTLYLKFIKFEIPIFFIKIIRSNYTFTAIILIFELIHYFQYIDNLDIILSFFVSYIVTRHARDYGIYYSMLFHTMYNALILSNNILFVRHFPKKPISDQLLVTCIIISFSLLILYLYKIIKAKPIEKSYLDDKFNTLQP